MVTAMLPELHRGLHMTLSAAASSVTLYMIPFASLMLVSGTLAERWGRRRTVRIAYAAYGVSSLACALAPGAAVFFAGRVGQGAANAFTTPVLAAAIADLTPVDRLGRSMGRYSSLQAAGQGLAPLLGGLAAVLNWRLAFVAGLFAALALALVPPPDRPTAADRSVSPAQQWRSLRNRRLVLTCLIAFLLYFTAMGTMVLAALRAGEQFNLGPGSRGLLIAAFGLTGLLAGARLGSLLDRIGVHRFAAASLFGLALSAAAVGVAPHIWMMAVALAIAGAASTAGRASVNALAVSSTPDNRTGAMSMTLAWQFLGGALAPLLLLPLYRIHPPDALFVAASMAMAAAATALALEGTQRDLSQ